MTNPDVDTNRALRRILAAIFVLITIIILGTVGFWSLSHFRESLFDCFYMTIITITTIGYGELLTVNTTHAGRLFTIFVALGGIGSFTFILTYFIALLASGAFFKAFRQYITSRKAKKMKQHFIICGSGEIGYSIAEELLLTQREFIIVDITDAGASRYLGRDVHFLIGDATDEGVLLKAGIKAAAGLFAVAGDDNLNLVITFTARQMNDTMRIIAKARSANHIEKLRKAGADAVISPYLVGGLRMVSEMVRPAVVSFLDMMLRERDSNYRIEEINVPADAIGKTISDTRMQKRDNSLLLALQSQGQWIYNPPLDYLLQEQDVLVFLATPDGRAALEERSD
jgi:voltage-gated potassium channel